jgi:alpha-galactosidase
MNKFTRCYIKTNVMPKRPRSESTPPMKWYSLQTKEDFGSDWRLTKECGVRAGWIRYRSLLRLVTCFVIFYAIRGDAGAQNTVPSISYNPQTHVFRIDGAGVSYIFGVNEKNELQSLYWGQSLNRDDPFPPPTSRPGHTAFDPSINATPQEFVAWGGALYSVPDLKITFPNGNRDLVLRYTSHSIRGNALSVVLKDISLDVYVTLEYRIDQSTGILCRSAVIENKTQAPFTIEQTSSATWNLPQATDYQLRYLTGRWAGEWNLQQQALHPGKIILESRRGSTGNQNNPWFAIERGTQPDEDHGDVWFGALGWSGSWEIAIEENEMHEVRVAGGFNPFDFAYQLAPGEELRTPPFYGGFSHDGIGGASRLLHRFEVETILPHAPQPRLRPVLYNSWEATEFNVDEAGQEMLAEKAAKIGVERFVVDDGWFGERNNDHAGLGDWFVNPKKFPHGLKPLIDHVHSLGMDFGLWVEPEMVNLDSELYRKHPEWVLNFPGRPRTEGRHQLVLNLARPDVKAYVYGFLDKLLTDNDIAFLKWDYNRNWSEPGWPAVSPQKEKEVYVRYIENLYSILEQLREHHPNVEIESCSGGGGRVDLGIMRYTDEVWPSDNTDPFDRLSIQNGFTYAYTPGVMMAWVTDSHNWVNNRSTSLEYRFLSAMQGSLGISAKLSQWTPEDFATARKMIAQYKQIRPTIQRGKLFRLISPQNGSEFSASESVSTDLSQAVIFTYLHSSEMGYPFPGVYPRGLDPQAIYSLQVLAGKTASETPASASGAYWMQHGLNVNLRGDFQAAAFLLEKIEPDKSHSLPSQ